ncbi:MAG: cobalt-zinc-cadmium efflux system outer membrane protein [Planctomycetota bacterium]|jgi:cobalt-zinc-cadmium efflux system outer membrane protein
MEPLRIISVGLLATALAACAATPNSTPSTQPGQDLRPATSAVPSTLTDAVLHGLANNAGLLAARNRAEAAGELPAQARRLPNPKLMWTEFVEELQTRTGPHVRRLSLSQALPWPGTLRAAGEAAEGMAAAAEGMALGSAASARRAVEHAWIERAQLSTELALQEQQVALLHTLEPVVLTRIRAGSGQQALLRLEVELARSEETLRRLRKAHLPLDAKLATALSMDELPSTPPPLEAPTDLELDADALGQLLREHSPRLITLRAKVRAAQAKVRLADRKRKPMLGVGLDYLQVDDSIAGNPSGSGDDPIALRLSMDLPVWRAADDAAERGAAHELRASHLEYEHAQRQLNADLAAILFRAENAESNRKLHRDVLLPRAEESLRLTLAAYRAGQASLTDLIDAERLQLALALTHTRAVRDTHLAIADLRALLGEDLQ